MGCFSYMCKECGKPILSNSFRGQLVRLYLLKESKIIEEMSGEYDSYGRVFSADQESIKWQMDWGEICTLDLNDDPRDGIAAIHEKCYNPKYTKLPTGQSQHDPNQGWGEDGEFFGDTDSEMEFNELA